MKFKQEFTQEETLLQRAENLLARLDAQEAARSRRELEGLANRNFQLIKKLFFEETVIAIESVALAKKIKLEATA